MTYQSHSLFSVFSVRNISYLNEQSVVQTLTKRSPRYCFGKELRDEAKEMSIHDHL